MKIVNMNLREMPGEVVALAKSEAAKRGMTLREWMIETIRFRLDLLLPPKKAKKGEV